MQLYPLLLLWMIGISTLAYIVIAVDWFSVIEWLDPYNFKGGIINGAALREQEEFDKRETDRLDRSKEEHEEWAKANANIPELPDLGGPPPHPNSRRPGAFLRTLRAPLLQGSITGHAAAPDAEFLRRYGSPKSMTLQTLERLMEERKAAKDAEFEEGF